MRGGGHVQMGLWLMTIHWAARPQVPGQGSVQRWLMQASLSAHSELTTHSGRQVGGVLINPGRHEHTAWPFTSRH